ncbi:MAG: serine hydrolase domain-containing protein, partial [Stackebrandtia sp.]
TTHDEAGGVRDTKSNKPADTGNRVRIGSVTKVFTTAVFLQLAAEGTVDLDADVRDYLPGLLPEDYPAIRVDQLLDHTSGLPSPRFDGGDSFDWQYEHRFDRWDTEDLLANAFEQPVKFSPGTEQDYLNVNSMVAGLIIEATTGSTWEKELHDRIAEPLDLDDTYAPGNDCGIRGRHQRGYQTTDGGLVDVTKWNQSITWAAGDMISTTSDLRVFTTALFGGEVVPKSQLDNMFTVPDVPVHDGDDDPSNDEPATKSMGLERMELPGGLEVWGKTGARYGFTAGLGGTRDGERLVAYSVNDTDAKSSDSGKVAQAITMAAFGY